MQKSLTPKIQGKVGLKRQRSSNIEKVLMFSLHYVILYRSFNANGLMNAFRGEKICHEKFIFIINSNNFNMVLN